MMHDETIGSKRLIDRASSSLTEAGASPAFVTRVMAVPGRARLTSRPNAMEAGRAPAAACLAVPIALGGWWMGGGNARVNRRTS
jgi:hypothetical protein